MTNKKFLATFAVGTLFGCSVLLSIMGHDLDQLYLKVASCLEEKQQLDEDRQHLTEQLSHAQRGRVLRKIIINVEKAPDDFVKLKVKARAKDQLRPLMNKELTLLEQQPDLFKRLLEERPYRISDQSITLKINTLVIGETTTVYLTAEKEQVTLQHGVDSP
ncbi:MAG TPA: hypothetical protein VFV52_06680 [Bacilli bacterium]|nr:hypothetical protein [Bacilli bacterium]